MIFRSLAGRSELNLLVSLSRKSEVTARWIGGMLDQGDTRPEWCRIALGPRGELRAAHAFHSPRPEGSPAQVALLGHADRSAAEALLRHDLRHFDLNSLGAHQAVYTDGHPRVAELRAEQEAVLLAVGFRVTVPRVLLGRPAGPIDVPNGLSFRPASSVAPDRLRGIFRDVGDGSLDYEMRTVRSEAGPDAEAAYRLDRALARDFRDDWFVIGLDGSGTPVGYVQSAVVGDGRAILAEIGVVAARRGSGYVNDLLAYGTGKLAGFPEVVSTTDAGNVPMRAAFARAGYAETGTRTDFGWDRPGHHIILWAARYGRGMELSPAALPVPRLDLADYRQRVVSMFLSDLDLDGFRKAKDELFATHPQSPVEPEERAGFAGLRYYPPSADAIVTVAMRPARGELAIETNGPDGAITYERVGILETPYGELTLWWIKAYGGGLFLPFRDGTASVVTSVPSAPTAAGAI